MTEKFLKAKHWQLFLLMFGIPIVLQIILMVSVVSRIDGQGDSDPAVMLTFVKFFPAIIILFMAVFFGWFWSVAIGLQKKVPDNVRMKVKKFKVFFFIPLIYLLVFMIGISIFMSNPPGSDAELVFTGSLFAVIIPLHLFTMFCIFYNMYFVAKTFKTVELQRKVKFEDFAGEFFMIWFYPIGIWILQPKINRMIEA